MVTSLLQRRRRRPEGAHVLGLWILRRQPVGRARRVGGAELRLVDGRDPHLPSLRALGAGLRVAVVAHAVEDEPEVAARVVRAEARQVAIELARAGGVEPG